MRKELDSYLVQKYPKIFIDRYEDMKKTAICWGFEHSDGWFWLIDNLCDGIQSYIDNNSHLNIHQVVVTQVKEKFGGLHFYYNGGDESIHGMVRLAEHMSYGICEECGSTKKVGRTSGWILTICEECSKLDEHKNRPWKLIEDKPVEPSKELRKIKIDKLNGEI